MFSKIKKKLFITVGLVIIVELFLRICYHQKLATSHFPMIYERDSILGYKYIPHAQDYNRRPIFYSDNININSFGYNDLEFSHQKKKGVFRIIIVGSSEECGFETGAPKTYVSLLREKMKKVSNKIEIINCSIDGIYSTTNLINRIEKEIIGYQPDVVLLTTSLKLYEALLYRTLYKDFILIYQDLKDLVNAKKYVDQLHYHFSYSKWLYDYLYSFRAICRYYTNNENDITDLLSKMDLFQDKKRIKDYTTNLIKYGNFSRINFTYEESLEIFKELSDSLKSINSKLVIYNRFRNSHIEKDFLKSAGVGYLGMDSKYNDQCTYGKEDGHSTQVGHEKSAIAFYDALIKSDIIPEEFLNLKDKPVLKEEDSTKVYLDLFDFEGLKASLFHENFILKKTNVTKIVSVDFNPVENSEVYYQLFNKYYKLSGNDITIDRKEMLNIKSVKELIIRLNKLIINEQPRLIVTPIPIRVLEDYPKESIDLLHKFESYCRMKGIDFLFTYFGEHPDLSILESMFKERSMYFESVNLNTNNSIFESFTEEKLVRVVAITKADFLYKKTKELLKNKGEFLKEGLDLARGKLVRVSSLIKTNKFNSDFITSNRKVEVYGTTGWLSETLNGYSNHKEWISIDLNNMLEIDRVILYPIYSLDMKMEPNGFPVGFKIQTSNDGIIWKTVKEVKNHPVPKVYDPQVFNFKKCYTRYVRILGTDLQRNDYDEGSLFRMALSGVEIYNTQMKD